jgi:hypothetical protein
MLLAIFFAMLVVVLIARLNQGHAKASARS